MTNFSVEETTPLSGPGIPHDNPAAGVQRPPFREALRFWFKLGWISFGGTAAHIAIMHDELVQKKRWISNGRFLHALSHCMVLPGPEAQQLAIYIGWKLHGKRGGVVAGTLFVLPSMFVLLALSLIYVKFGNLPWIAAMFNGLKPAVIALVVIALHRLAKRALHGPVQSGVAAAAFVCMFFFDVSLLLVMLGAVVLGSILAVLTPGLLPRPSAVDAEENEAGYYINLPLGDTGARRSPEASREADFNRFATLASANICLLLLRWGLSLLEEPGVVLYKGRIRDHRRLVHSHSVHSARCGIEAALADEFPDDRRLCIGRDNPRASDHRGRFCWIHGRVQPLPRLAMDGYVGPRSNNVLHLSTVLSLCVCRCASGGANAGQADDSGRLGINHRCRSRRDP